MSLVLLTTSTISGRVPALLQYQPLLFPDKDQTVVIPTWLHIDLIIPMMSLGFNSMMHMLAATCCKIVRVIGSVCVLSFWLFFLLKPVQFSRIWLNLESTSARVKSYQLAKIVSGGCAPAKKTILASTQLSRSEPFHCFGAVCYCCCLPAAAAASCCAASSCCSCCLCCCCCFLLLLLPLMQTLYRKRKQQAVPWWFFVPDVTFHYLRCDFSVSQLWHRDVVTFPAWCDLIVQC